MDIVTRNFFRLLAAGAFDRHDDLEPMSRYKWEQLCKLAQLHDVASYVAAGVSKHQDDFYMQQALNYVTRLYNRQEKKGPETANELTVPTHLTNPILNLKLQKIVQQTDVPAQNHQLILLLLNTSRFFLNEGIPVKQLVELGLFLRNEGHHVDFIQLEQWLADLHMAHMAQLAGEFLVELFGFDKDEVPFISERTHVDIDDIAKDIYYVRSSHEEDFYFSQGQNVFVHTANSMAVMWTVRRSAKFFKYCPQESFTNFFASFAHSLSHIEE